MNPIDIAILTISFLLFISVLLSKVSGRFSMPSVLLFLVIGMLAGSEGPGGIYFDHFFTAQAIGIIALVMILFDGGLGTDWQKVRPVVWKGLSLATLGVALTAVCFACVAKYILNFSWLEAMLLGSIVSSTDAAAVFSILRTQNASLRGDTQPLLELESGSNDPMAVFLTIGFITLLSQPINPF